MFFVVGCSSFPAYAKRRAEQVPHPFASHSDASEIGMTSPSKVNFSPTGFLGSNLKPSKFEADAHGRDRIELHDRSIFVDLVLLGDDLRLDRGIGGGVDASESRNRIAGGAGQVQRGLRLALKDDAKVIEDGEVVMVRDGIAETEHHHGRGFPDRQHAVAMYRIGRAAAEAHITKAEVLPSRRKGGGCDLVGVVHQHTGADMEEVAERSDVHQSFYGAKLHGAVVMHSVVAEALAEAETVEASADVEEGRDGCAHVATNAQK